MYKNPISTETHLENYLKTIPKVTFDEYVDATFEWIDAQEIMDDNALIAPAGGWCPPVDPQYDFYKNNPIDDLDLGWYL